VSFPEHEKPSPPPVLKGAGVGKVNRPLTPEERVERIERLKRARAARLPPGERMDQILHDPLHNLNKFRRNEWEVIARYLADPRLNAVQLAQLLGYRDPLSVKRILARPHVQATIAAIRSAQVAAMIRGDFGAQATLKAAQTKAAVKVVETIDNAQAGPKLNLTAATEVLDRTGLGKASSVQVHHIHEILTHFTPEELDRYGRGGPPPERFKDVFEALEGPTLLPKDG
jgi:hypothetical protein